MSVIGDVKDIGVLAVVGLGVLAVYGYLQGGNDPNKSLGTNLGTWLLTAGNDLASVPVDAINTVADTTVPAVTLGESIAWNVPFYGPVFAPVISGLDWLKDTYGSGWNVGGR